ncbi:MAG: DUF3857 domain-containing protein [Bacteroidota bacterium]|nr:DUF3857 domain-containing protein [Bacteroidota bacterium]
MHPKKINITALLFTVFTSAFFVCRAQQQVAEFAQFSQQEIDLTQCAFDKDADAVVLFDKATAGYNADYNLITERRIRFKILKERGIERGNIHISYYSGDGFEVISNIDATVLNVDNQKNEVRSKLDRKSIYDKKVNKYYSEITFALPNIKVGSIIEYKYQSFMKHYGGLKDWIFQSDMPVALSSYYLTIIPNAEFAYSVYKSHDMHVNVKPDSQSGSVLFEMANIPGLRDEAYMGAARDYLQRVKFQFSGYKRVEGGTYGTSSTTTTSYVNTWKEMARDLADNRDFGSQLNKKLDAATELQAEWAAKAEPFLKMKSIHEYVRSHFNWNHIYSKYCDGGVKTIWEKKTGTTGDINLLLVNLLKAAGLTVQPLLVSERDFGKVDTTYPYIDQFDKVVAYVTLNDKHYILDGTDRLTPSSTIPYKLLNTTGFVADPKNATLVNITDSYKKNNNMITFVSSVSEDGRMNVDVAVDNYDYSKIERKEKYNRDKKGYEKDFFESLPATHLDTFAIDGIDNDSLPIHHTAKLEYNLDKTGDYYLLNYNLFTGLHKNPFINEQRFSDINFGCEHIYLITGTINLPKNLTPEALPKSLRLLIPDKSMTLIREVNQIENTIQISVRISFAKSEYGADAYPDVQAFYKQMLDLLNEPIVLKAKA